MFQGGISLKLWNECILIACYLINRLPTSVLNGKCLYELVYGYAPNLSHIRVFGCLCYATVLDTTDKFSSRSHKCVLIGFATVKKTFISCIILILKQFSIQEM